jgi:copper(I)-binding protein
MRTLLLFLLILFPPENNIKIKDAWMRPASEKMASALYFTIENTGESADTLYKVDSDIAEKVEIHETYTEGELMGMRKVDFIAIPGKSSFELKPGAQHVMLMKLKKNINVGDEEKFTLYFKSAGEIDITAKAKK